MGTQNEERIKYYYTWEGLDRLYYGNYDEYKMAEKEVNEKVKGNVKPLGFEYEEEAEAFREGKLDEYIEDNYRAFDASEYEAVVYTDGSWDKDIASYGLIIFFKDETEPYIESGTFKDVEDGEYKIVRYNENGKQNGQPEHCPFKSKPGKSGYISVAESDSGEFLGAKRSLEICCKEKGLKKILIISDNENVAHEYELKDSKDKDDVGVEGEYRGFLREIKKDFLGKDNDLKFIKIDSHGGKKGNKHQYMINEEKYLHAVYNDLVDILAKMEIKENIGDVVNPKENFNVFRSISNEFERFSNNPDADKTEADDRRKYAREKFVEKVLKKYDGKFRPQF